jgi:Mlc titration factor MtfA (ptsG expression regulator)
MAYIAQKGGRVGDGVVSKGGDVVAEGVATQASVRLVLTWRDVSQRDEWTAHVQQTFDLPLEECADAFDARKGQLSFGTVYLTTSYIIYAPRSGDGVLIDVHKIKSVRKVMPPPPS